MGPTHLIFLAIALPHIAALHTKLHEHMSSDELQSVFHVDHHSLVPEYQLVKLHHVSKRYIPSPGGDKYHDTNKISSSGSGKSAHDKVSSADYLIKNAHKFKDMKSFGRYGAAVRLVERGDREPQSPAEEADFVFVGSGKPKSEDLDKVITEDRLNGEVSKSDNKESTIDSENSKVEFVGEVGGESISVNSEIGNDSGARGHMEDVEHFDDDMDDEVHKIKFEAFGKPVELVLRKTEGLFKRDGLKMWSVVGNDTQPHGVEFIETEEMGDEKDHIGEIFQDEDSLAALVIRRDPKAGLLVEGSIGHDLVIKPLPSTLSPNPLPKEPIRKGIPPEEDDEMFMSPNQDDMVSIDTGLPIKRNQMSKKNLFAKKDHNSDGTKNQPKDKGTNEEARPFIVETTNRTETINKMDGEDMDIIYDDEAAKEEIRMNVPKDNTKRQINIKDEVPSFADLRKALIEALSGAKHVVYKRETHADHNDEFSDYAFMEPDRLQKRFRGKRSAEDDEPVKKRKKREAPYVIYPEILVIVDYDGYRLHGGDNLQIKRYFVSFWNGVDLRYKLLKGPKIRISIAGIIISRGRDATPYLERNRVGRDAIDSAAALTDMGKYLFRERRLPVYDIAVAVTKYDMCRRRKGGRCTKGTAGFAYVGGACVVNKRLEKVNSVAIIEDTGGFSGIIVAAHEVGHLLGAVHDGSPPPSYLGGPGAEKCRWEDGFIMSDLRHTEKGFRWSPCSVISFHHFLNGDTATCLYNSPHEDESLPRVLPGKLLSLDAQCRKDRGTSACFKDERVCAQLFCFDAGSGYCVAYRPAAEGSPCGDGQYCINGRCVAEHENIIPDYSHHTPSYVRRETSPFFNGTVQRYLIEQTTPAYGTYPVVPFGQTYFYPSTGQSPETISQPLSPISQQFPTQRPFQFHYNSLPVTRQSFSYSPYFSTTRNPYDFRNFPVYHYTAETKQTQYTLPSSFSSQAISTESTTSTTTTTQRPFFLRFTFSSTKNPYDFKDYTTKPPIPKSTQKVNTTSTTIGTTTPATDLSSSTLEADLASTTASTSSTTKPKYGFLNKLDLRDYFNRTTTKNPYDFDLTNYKDISNNNIKRSYSIRSYFGSANSPVSRVVLPGEIQVAQASQSVPIHRILESTNTSRIK